MLLAQAIDWRMENLEPIVTSVFQTMVSTDVQLAATGDDPVPASVITAAVYLTGEWKGAVLLTCTPRQACAFAGRFLGSAPPDAVDDDVRDVLGELANMIAGNLKCTLAAGIRISIPSVVDGCGYSLRVCGGRAAYPFLFCNRRWSILAHPDRCGGNRPTRLIHAPPEPPARDTAGTGIRAGPRRPRVTGAEFLSVLPAPRSNSPIHSI